MKNILMRTNEAMQHFKISRMTLYRWTKENDFPKPLRRGTVILYNAEKIEEWLSHENN